MSPVIMRNGAPVVVVPYNKSSSKAIGVAALVASVFAVGSLLNAWGGSSIGPWLGVAGFGVVALTLAALAVPALWRPPVIVADERGIVFDPGGGRKPIVPWDQVAEIRTVPAPIGGKPLRAMLLSVRDESAVDVPERMRRAAVRVGAATGVNGAAVVVHETVLAVSITDVVEGLRGLAGLNMPGGRTPASTAPAAAPPAAAPPR